MENQQQQAQRIQTSVLNGIERKALIWMAERMPRWVTSDMLTLVGVFGAALIGAGYALSANDYRWLWLCTLGLFVNWFGDSLDGTLARVRNTQRPVYGYYIDHTLDCVNEMMMFVGAGLSGYVHLGFAMIAFALYLMLTINVSINAHLKSEFKLTYAKMGPTEFRLLMVIVNLLLIFIPSFRALEYEITLVGKAVTMHALDFACLLIIVVLAIIYVCTIVSDTRKYARIDPPKQR